MSKYPELQKLEEVLDSIDPEKARKYLKWIKLSNGYLTYEDSGRFDPAKQADYQAGDVVTINFGFNVDKEFGGRHYGVVIENNTRSAGTVMVVPLSSCSSENDSKIKDPSVYLGYFKELNFEGTPDLHSFAVVNQMRPISKMRISTPVRPTEEKFNLGEDVMKKIHASIEESFTSTYPKNKEPMYTNLQKK